MPLFEAIVNAMDARSKYYVVEATALPDVILRVVDAKRMLRSGEALSVNEAVRKADLSRSAFYKYKDAVSPLMEAATNKIVTLQAGLRDEAGVLSGILNLFANFKVNILTINQTIPVNGQATVTISIRTGDMKDDVEQLIKAACELKGVLDLNVLASE